MLIDWFTIIAQVINFLILVWLLKKFLYKPILDTIGEREKKVKAILEDADAKKKDASSEREDYQHKKQELEQQRADYLGKATRDADAERERLLERARSEYEDKRSQFERGLAQEQTHLAQALSSRVRKEVFAISRKALQDLAGTSVEAGMTDRLIHQLKTMDGESKKNLVADFQAESGEVLVRTADALSPDQQEAIITAMADALGTRPQFRFQTSPELIGGIEITLAGKKLAWSIREYLSSLENDVHEILKSQSEERAQPGPAYDLNPQQNVGFRADSP